MKFLTLTTYHSGQIRFNPAHIVQYSHDKIDGYGNPRNGSRILLSNGDSYEVKESPALIDAMLDPGQ